MSSSKLCISPHPSSKPIANSLQATQFIRTLHGGSQPSLMQASDGDLYVVKLADDPQGRNIRANEVIGSELLKAVGLPTPAWKPILVPLALRKEHARALQGFTSRRHAQDRLHFASRFLGDDPNSWIFEFLPSTHYARLGNKGDFLGIFLFDLLCENAHRRKCVYVADKNGKGYRAVFLGNGHLFGRPAANDSFAGITGLPACVRPETWTDREIDLWIGRMEAGIAAGLQSLDRHPAKLWYKENLDKARERLTIRLADLRTLFWTELSSSRRPPGKERVHPSNAILPLYDPELSSQRDGPIWSPPGVVV